MRMGPFLKDGGVGVQWGSVSRNASRGTPLLSIMRMKCILPSHYEHRFVLSQYADGFGLIRLLYYSFFRPIYGLIAANFSDFIFNQADLVFLFFFMLL
jgi:hypothetical protein